MVLKVLSPSGTIVSLDSVEAVFLPGTLGEFEVLKHHAPIVSSLERGEIRYRIGGEEGKIEIASGFVTVKDDIVEACIEK